jgi:hypothetical protein
MKRSPFKRNESLLYDSCTPTDGVKPSWLSKFFNLFHAWVRTVPSNLRNHKVDWGFPWASRVGMLWDSDGYSIDQASVKA